MSASYIGTVTTVGETMARSISDSHAFKIFMDEPVELGGQNGAPSPLDYILASQGGCINYMVFFIAKEMDIPIDKTEIIITGKLDPAKFSGTRMNVRAGNQEIDVQICVTSTASQEEIAMLKAAVEQRCPVSDNLTHATPVSISMTTR
mgnify:CR=1 FL=1|tara:strand:+ start:509371 stop:509814 length:444 start_codon:yes stop_codon:yes gene_type:complete